MVRFTGQMFVSFLWGELFYIAIPEDEIYGFNWKQLMIFIPAVIAFGNNNNNLIVVKKRKKPFVLFIQAVTTLLLQVSGSLVTLVGNRAQSGFPSQQPTFSIPHCTTLGTTQRGFG